ncbi:MAG: phosphoenolpyruvate--protein phosphotransferase [Gammaproteobacteria bacterium]|nr:phosphoenolpyruvate--protein phosphotransferase [Gammaproteobacteria bacterium]
MSLMFCGIGVSRGIAIGEAAVFRRDSVDIRQVQLKPKDLPAEVRRFRSALKNTKKHLLSVRDGIPDTASSDVSAFIETHLLMLDDSVLSQRPIELIKEHSCNAESALQMQREELSRVFAEMEDPYIATRMDDVNHVIDEILRAFTPRTPVAETQDWAGKIIIADDLTPADTLVMQAQGVAGFITETGGQLSHTAILARSLGIPAIVGVHNIRQYITQHEELIVDGESGMLLAEPEPAMIAGFVKRRKMIRQRARELSKLADQQAITTDGVELSLQANIEVEDDIKSLKRVQADGVGLFRTEFLYLSRDDIPTEEEHYKVYTRILRALKGAPLTIRTVDLGADKQVSSKATGPLAHNPAMGLRGIRLCLSEPTLLMPQLRAIMRASAKGPINIMFPMLTNLSEVRQCLELIESVKAALASKGYKYDPDIKIGAMIEVPGAALAAEQFARHLDFLSIGTNDLIQYTLAIDRIDDQVDYLYDPLHPAVLQLIKLTISAGRKANIPVGMCGEMAGDERYVRLLLGLGLTQFSMPPNQLLAVKHMLNSADRKKLTRLANNMMDCDTAADQQKLLDRINAGTPAVSH